MFVSFRSVSVVGALLCGVSAHAQVSEKTFLEQFVKPDQVLSVKEAAGNLSGVVYNFDTQTYFVIQNNSYQIVEYDKTFTKSLRTIKLVNLPDKDTEDIAYLGKDQFAINMENNLILIFTLKAGQTSVDVSPKRDDVQALQLPAPRKDNKGIEGLCFAPKVGANGTFYAVQEDRPKRVFMIPRPADSKDVFSHRNLKYFEPFNVDKIFKHVMSDLAGCTFDEKTGHVIILSHESSRLMEVTQGGVVVKTLDLPTVVEQYEGVTVGPEGELVLVSEPDKVVIFKPKAR